MTITVDWTTKIPCSEVRHTPGIVSLFSSMEEIGTRTEWEPRDNLFNRPWLVRFVICWWKNMFPLGKKKNFSTFFWQRFKLPLILPVTGSDCPPYCPTQDHSSSLRLKKLILMCIFSWGLLSNWWHSSNLITGSSNRFLTPGPSFCCLLPCPFLNFIMCTTI